MVAYFIKKRREKPTTGHSNPIYDCSELKPTVEKATTSHSNPTYDFSDHQPENQTQDHHYTLMDKTTPHAWSKDQSDSPEQWYDDIGNKDLTEEFADDPIYDCLEPSQKGGHAFSFTNQSYLTSSDT